MIKPMAKRKRSEHYVNNKEFLAALIKYQEDIEIARLQDKPKPVIPRYINHNRIPLLGLKRDILITSIFRTI